MTGRFLGHVICCLIAMASPLSSEAQAQAVVGEYCLRGVMEVGSCMRVSSGGKFEYFLSYGAYDENSEGEWKLVSGEIVVDTPAYDKRPTFSFKRMQKSATGAFDIIVESGAGGPINGIDVQVTCDGTTKDVGVSGTGDFKVDCAGAPAAVILALRMFNVAPQTLDVAGRAGADKAYVFGFDAGDLGRRPFVAKRLQIAADGALVVTFTDSPIPQLNGRPLRYVRER